MDAARVTVSANAVRTAFPDSFTFNAAVSVAHADAAKARHALVTAFQQLEQAIEALPETVRGHAGGLQTWREELDRQLTWRVQRAMLVTGRDLALVADTAAAIATVPDVTVDGPTWLLDRDNPVWSELQDDVVQLARERAARYATALNGTLGRLIELHDPEGANHHFPVARMDAMPLEFSAKADVGELDFTPAELTVSASVVASWTLVLPE